MASGESDDQKKHMPKGELGELDTSLPDAEVKRRLATYIPQKGEHAPKYLVFLLKLFVSLVVLDLISKSFLVWASK